MKKIILSILAIIVLFSIGGKADTACQFSGNLGNKGRLFIPSCGIEVAVNRKAEGQSNAPVVDKPDSAAWMEFGDTPIIGDHRDQAFKDLPEVEIGDELYLWNGKTAEKFVLTAKTRGYREKKQYVCNDGVPVHETGADLALCTCADMTGNNIHVLLFKKVM